MLFFGIANHADRSRAGRTFGRLEGAATLANAGFFFREHVKIRLLFLADWSTPLSLSRLAACPVRQGTVSLSHGPATSLLLEQREVGSGATDVFGILTQAVAMRHP